MNRLFKNAMIALAGLTVAAAVWATPITADATRVLGSQSNGATTVQQTTTQTATENTETAEELIGTGVVTADSVRVRKDATTSADVVGKASQNTSVDVTGEKTDGEGKVWYAVTYVSEGKTVKGYIRSDLMNFEAIEVPVEEPVVEEEAPAEEPVVEEAAPADDYYVQYTDADWYLVDQTMGKQYKISELLNAQTVSANNAEEMESQAGTFRLIIVALAIVVLVLIGVVTFLIIKLRNADDGYEYDDDEDEDDEDEDDEEEEDDEPVRRRGLFGRRRYDEDDEDEEDEEEEEEEPVRRAPARRVNVRPARHYEEDMDDEEDEEEEYQPRRAQKPAKNQKDKNWQSKNFLEDDDLEFEFLDLK